MSAKPNPIMVPQNLVQPVTRPIWMDPPDQWENLDIGDYVALPAIGAEANVVSFQIPLGRNGVVKKIANNFVGGGWVEGSGGVTWRIQVDGAPPPGATTYDSILASLGNPSDPVEIAGFRVFENQILSIVVRNVNIVVAGQFSGGRLVGWLYPRDMESDEIWT